MAVYDVYVIRITCRLYLIKNSNFYGWKIIKFELNVWLAIRRGISFNDAVSFESYIASMADGWNTGVNLYGVLVEWYWEERQVCYEKILS
jgi:hypothetical protein